MPVGANAIVTLAEARQWLQKKTADTADDSFIEALVDRMTSRIESYIKRFVKKRTGIVEFLDGNGLHQIRTRQYPIISVSEVKVDTLRQFGAETIIDPNFFVVEKEEGIITYGNIYPGGGLFPFGEKIIKVTYDAAYDPIPDDLKLACLKLIAVEFRRSKQGADGIAGESVLGYSVTYKDGMPLEVHELLQPYRKFST